MSVNNNDYSLKSAKKAYKENGLKEWTIDFLLNKGSNLELAEILKSKDNTKWILKEFPLAKLHRIMGPESGMKFSEKQEIWEKRVNKVLEKIKLGFNPPPIIVTDFWEPLSIADGNHRQEALLKLNKKSDWVIFINKN